MPGDFWSGGGVAACNCAGCLEIFACFSSGVLAQLVERLVRNEKVRGSNPLGSTSFFRLLGGCRSSDNQIDNSGPARNVRSKEFIGWKAG